MTKLEELEQEIYDSEIEFFDKNLNASPATIEINGNFSIFADRRRFETQDEYFCALAHEYGHCQTGTTHRLQSTLFTKGYCENAANKYLVHKYVPLEDLDEAARNGNYEIFDIADYLALPPQMIVLAIEVYKREGKIQ